MTGVERNFLSVSFGKNSRVPSLDGIRGFAILLVMLWHGLFVPLSNLPNHPVAERLIGLGRLSWSGVDLFFVLSGFLIGGILLDASASTSYFSTFYIRRAHRILPLYAAVVSCVLIAPRLFGGWNHWASNQISVGYYATFLQNFWMAKNNLFGSNVLGVTWSLAVEEQFYLSLPIAIRYLSRSQLWWLVAGMIGCAPMLRAILIRTSPQGAFASYVLMPCRADALGFGVVAALLIRSPKLWATVLRCKGYLYAVLGAASFAVLALMLSHFTVLTSELLGLEYSLLALFYFLILVGALTGGVAEKIFSLRGLRYLGTIAYGLYLLHQVFVHGMRALAWRIYPGQSGWITLAASAFGLCLATATASLSWKYLEEPLVKRGHRYQYARKSLPLMAAKVA